MDAVTLKELIIESLLNKSLLSVIRYKKWGLGGIHLPVPLK